MVLAGPVQHTTARIALRSCFIERPTFSKRYWIALSTLATPFTRRQDRVPAFSNKEAFAVVESELGVPFEDVYELVEPEPIAAASIGQVGGKESATSACT